MKKILSYRPLCANQSVVYVGLHHLAHLCQARRKWQNGRGPAAVVQQTCTKFNKFNEAKDDKTLKDFDVAKKINVPQVFKRIIQSIFRSILIRTRCNLEGKANLIIYTGPQTIIKLCVPQTCAPQWQHWDLTLEWLSLWSQLTCGMYGLCFGYVLVMSCPGYGTSPLQIRLVRARHSISSSHSARRASENQTWIELVTKKTQKTRGVSAVITMVRIREDLLTWMISKV